MRVRVCGARHAAIEWVAYACDEGSRTTGERGEKRRGAHWRKQEKPTAALPSLPPSLTRQLGHAALCSRACMRQAVWKMWPHLATADQALVEAQAGPADRPPFRPASSSSPASSQQTAHCTPRRTGIFFAVMRSGARVWGVWIRTRRAAPRARRPSLFVACLGTASGRRACVFFSCLLFVYTHHAPALPCPVPLPCCSLSQSEKKQSGSSYRACSVATARSKAARSRVAWRTLSNRTLSPCRVASPRPTAPARETNLKVEPSIGGGQIRRERAET